MCHPEGRPLNLGQPMRLPLRAFPLVGVMISCPLHTGCIIDSPAPRVARLSVLFLQNNGHSASEMIYCDNSYDSSDASVSCISVKQDIRLRSRSCMNLHGLSHSISLSRCTCTIANAVDSPSRDDLSRPIAAACFVPFAPCRSSPWWRPSGEPQGLVCSLAGQWFLTESGLRLP